MSRFDNMSVDDLLAASVAVEKLVKEVSRAMGTSRESIEEAVSALMKGWPPYYPAAAKDDRFYWVRAKDTEYKRRGWRSNTHRFPWFVEGFPASFGDESITVLGEVERDDDTPNHPAPDHPEVLTTVEDVENAPENTVAALDEHYPIVKIGGLWIAASGRILGPRELVSSARSPIHVLRWGGSK